MPNALLIGYHLDQPSFRHRMATLLEPLRAAGWEVRTEQFPGGQYGWRTLARRKLLSWADVSILHQIKLSTPEAKLFSALSRKRIFDVDDAIYVRKPRRLGEAPDESIWRKRKFAATCRLADVVAAGNEVLAGVARAAARRIEVLPTSIEVSRYLPTRLGAEDPPTVVWIGSPENLTYLEMVRPALARLTERHPLLKLRVICSSFPQWPEVSVEKIRWSSLDEAESLAGGHIGIMPLSDDTWSRGKCAFKLLQYMAARLPCVASPVGANKEAVIDGFNGFHAASVDEWERSLEKLIVSPPLRARMGASGLKHVQERYALSRYQEQYVALLGRLAAR